MLVGQGEELAHGPGAGLAQGLEQPFHHGAEQLVGLQVQRRPRQARIAAVQQRGAEQVQAADGPVEQGPDDRLGGRIPGQLVQVALDHGGGVLFAHGATHRLKCCCIRANSTPAGCAPATLSMTTGEDASESLPTEERSQVDISAGEALRWMDRRGAAPVQASVKHSDHRACRPTDS